MSQEALKQADLSERRREQRYTAPAIYQKYISMEANGETTGLIDFSKNGVGFVSMKSYEIGESVECSLAAPKSMSEEVRFTVEVKHCQEISGEFIIGSHIKKIDDSLWFELFQEVHNYILSREDNLY